MLRNGFLWITILGFSAGCGIINIKKTGNSGARFENYSEELASNRILFSELPEPEELSINRGSISSGSGYSVDEDLEEAIAYFSQKKREETYFSGFTILVYSGVDRDQAFKARNDLYSYFPEIKAEMEYQQPRYLVKVGKYINRIEALYLFEKINEQFPTTRIIQDRFKRELVGKEQDLENVER